MERHTPTDPPEEPVNRIAAFLEQIEAKQQRAGSPEGAEIAALFQTIGDDPAVKAIVEQTLTTLSERYEQAPFDLASLKPLIRVLLKLGMLESVVQFVQWYRTLAPEPDVEIESIMAEAQKRLDEQGPA